MTNADKIRNMTDKELAEFIGTNNEMKCPDDRPGCYGYPYPLDNCVECWSEWLEKEAEQTMPETKKQKTMMEDFFEKFPNAPRKEKGQPIICPEGIYNVETYKDCGSFSPHGTCTACWSRPVPPQRECYKNATVIVEYVENAEPNISWVRQDDTERIGYEEAMKRVMKVKANE